MHRIAEEGRGRATGNTNQGKPSSEDDDQPASPWMRQLIEWSQELPGTRRISLHAQSGSRSGRSLRFHAEGPRVAGACRGGGPTPVDFAYMVTHRKSATNASAQKVNGQMVFRCATKSASGDRPSSRFSRKKRAHPPQPRLAQLRENPPRRKSKIRHWINEGQERAKKPRKWGQAPAGKTKRVTSAAASRKFPKADVLQTRFRLRPFQSGKISTPPVGFGQIFPPRQGLLNAALLGEPEKSAEPETADAKPTLVKNRIK